MEITCPNCSNEIVFGEKPPKFCDQCGKAISPELTGIVAPDSKPLTDQATVPPSGRITERIPADTIKEARTINHYELIQQLGSGGMGVVYEARDQTTGRHVALKLLSSGLTSDSENVDRFVREAKLAAQISHPRTTFIYEAGEHDGRPYIAMELMPGQTLQDVLEKEESLPVNKAVDYIIDVIDGLTAAHELDFIHRDVKPSNCFVAADGRIKIGDFGLSKSLVTDVGLTRTGTFMGTPLYAAPEQIRGTEVDNRTDIYSVGATLFTLIAGQPPFDGDAMSVTAQILTDAAPNIRKFKSNVPKDLARVIDRTLKKDPAERFASLADLKKSLTPFASGGASLTQIGRRSAAYMIDYVFTMLIAYIVVTLLAFIFISRKQIENPGADISGQVHRFQLYVALGMWTFVWLYFAILEGFWGKTIGKRILGLQVVNNQGEKPGIFRGLLRSFAIPSAFAVPIIFSLIRLFWVEEAVQDINMTSVISGWITARLAEILPALFCLLSMKQSNGLQGIHGMLSGTRVFRINRSTERTIAGLPNLDAKPIDRDLHFGSYEVTGLIAGNDAYQVFAARDEVLDRQVWIYYGDNEKLEKRNQHINRTSRFRWIQGGELDGHRWEAYEAAEGVPFNLLADLSGYFTWENCRYALQDFCEELEAAHEDETVCDNVSLQQFFVNKNGRGKFLEIALPTESPPVEKKEKRSAAFTSCETIQQAFDLVLQRQVLPESASRLLNDFSSQIKKPETISRFAEKLGEQNNKLASLQWDSRLGVLAVTLGVEWVILTGVGLLIGFSIFSLIGYLPIWKPLLITSIFATGYFVVGYFMKTSPVFRFMGIDIQKKNGGLASRFQCGCRMLISWLPFTIAFIAVVMSMMVGFEQIQYHKKLRQKNNAAVNDIANRRKEVKTNSTENPPTNTQSQTNEPQVISESGLGPAPPKRISPTEGIPKDVQEHVLQFLFVFIAGFVAVVVAVVGVLVSILKPERGIQDRLVGTRLVPK